MKKKQKVLLTVLFAFVGLLLIGGGVTAFLINYNLQTAPTVEILDDGNTVYASTQINLDYKGYRFKFTSGTNTFYIESQSNIVDISGNENLKLGENYSVSVCYLGEIEGNNSEYSAEVSWTSYKHLASPELVLSEDRSTISWSQVENADYYIVYHGSSFERVEGNELTLSLLSGGKKDIFVVACSNFLYYKTSAISNKLEDVVVYHELTPFTEIAYNDAQLILTLTGKENVKVIRVYINDKSFETTNFNIQRLPSGDYQYTINIAAVYVGSDIHKVGASPSSDNEYEVFNGEIIYL